MSIMNSFIHDIFERSSLAHYNKKSTITCQEIQTTVRLLLPGAAAAAAVVVVIAPDLSNWAQQGPNVNVVAYSVAILRVILQ